MTCALGEAGTATARGGCEGQEHDWTGVAAVDTLATTAKSASAANLEGAIKEVLELEGIADEDSNVFGGACTPTSIGSCCEDRANGF